MPVFISHRTADNTIASNVAFRLEHTYGIKCYVDDIDVQLANARGTRALTRLILERIAVCTNLLAIVTVNTKGSWWVPFEIGVARQAPRAITCMTTLTDADLPEYLLEWPVLRSWPALDEFARLYLVHGTTLADQVLQKRATATAQVSLVEEFETALKLALGQK